MDESKQWKDKNAGKPKPRLVDQQLLNSAYFGNCHQVIKYLKLNANPGYMEDRDGIYLHYYYNNLIILLSHHINFSFEQVGCHFITLPVGVIFQWF